MDQQWPHQHHQVSSNDKHFQPNHSLVYLQTSLVIALGLNSDLVSLKIKVEFTIIVRVVITSTKAITEVTADLQLVSRAMLKAFAAIKTQTIAFIILEGP